MVAASYFVGSKIALRKGQSYDMNGLVGQLQKAGFEEVDFVYEVGQYSQRGSIVDIFSYSNELLYRVDFFGDNIESIRMFDIERQLSVASVDSIDIVANTDGGDLPKISLLEFMSSDSVVVVNDIDFTVKRMDYIYEQALIKANEHKHIDDLSSTLADGETFAEEIGKHRTVELLRNYYKADTMEFSTTHQPNFDKNFDLISQNISNYIAEGYRIFIAADSRKQTLVIGT